VLRGVTFWHLQKFLQYINCIHSIYHSHLSPPSPIPGIIWTGIIFFHLHACLHSICTIFTLPPPSSPSSPLPLVPNSQNLFHPPALQCCKRKKWHFCLFQIATQGVSLWHFHVYMYYNPNWFISPIFLLSTSDPLLMVISTDLKILYLFLYREYINHVHLLNFLLLPSPTLMWPGLTVICFS
jgi:hypothetical protein